MNEDTPLIASGNQEVVDLLEKYLAKAKEGKAKYCFVGLCTTPEDSYTSGIGSMEMETTASALVDRLNKYLKDSIINRAPPIILGFLPADKVFFNMAGGPLSFDFIPWLVEQEMNRIRERAPFPLKVHFWMGRDGKAGLELPARVQMLNNVIRPALKLVGAIEDPTMTAARFKEYYNSKYIMEAYKAGESVPMLKAPEGATNEVKEWNMGRPSPIVITLRETTYWPHRNSNLEAWTKFAKYLQEQGERVVFLRDACKSEEPLEGFEIYPKASLDVLTRMALYELSKCVISVSAGPSALTLYSEIPWITFIDVKEDGHPFEADTISFWSEQMGVTPGTQYPWSKVNQQLIWKPDTYENLVEAWEQFKQIEDK